jgi:adenylate kinase
VQPSISLNAERSWGMSAHRPAKDDQFTGDIPVAATLPMSYAYSSVRRLPQACGVRVTLMGIQTSGKGSQGKRLASELRVPYIEISNVLRERAAIKDETGRAIAVHLRMGELVPDSVVTQVLALRLAKSSDVGFVLDGYPRQGTQVDTLDAMLYRLGVQLDAPVHLALSVDQARRRIADRLVCGTCGRSTSRTMARANERCPDTACDGVVTQRSDDQDPEVVERRISDFLELTMPIIAAYRESKRLIEIDADRDPELVYADLLTVLQRL